MHPPTSPIELAMLLQLFENHLGFVPGFEFEADGFQIKDLVARGLVNPPRSHLDAGCYTVGEELRKTIQRQ